MGNHNSGRRPSPTALKVLRGNPGKRHLQDAAEPPTGEVVKPEGLSAGASQFWDELAPICLAMRTLTVADVRAFTKLCELEATFVQATRGKDQPGWEQQRLERETATSLRPYYDFFGMTPSSRARIQVPKQAEAPVSKWAGVLK